METFFQHSAALTLTTTSRDHSLGDVEKCGDVDREDWDVRSVWKCWEDWEAIRAEKVGAMGRRLGGGRDDWP